MSVELIREKYTLPINTVELGRGLKVGGETGLPYLFDEGGMPNKPIVALEVIDCEPQEWPDHLKNRWGSSIKDPVEWAVRCVRDFKCSAICVRLMSIHPDWLSRSGDEAVKKVKEIANAVKVPLIIAGSGDDDKDNEVLPLVSQALKGQNCLFGIATQTNYKTLTVTCLADGHSIIADSPIDVNIAKQLNILISEMGFDSKRIVMHPSTASLGYGMEYVYSIMERARLAAFMGDGMLSMPFILFPGLEVWRVKEAKDFSEALGVNWEIATSVTMLQSGADILVLSHPDSASAVAKYIDNLSNLG